MSAIKTYLKWRNSDPIGCVFARLMSGVPEDFGQIIEELPAGQTPAANAAHIASRTTALIADPKALAAAFLLPGISDLKALAETVLSLRAHQGWGVETLALSPPPDLDLVVFRVVRELVFNGGTMPSEALVLGPFDEFPATRSAPVTAFEIFVGEPMKLNPKDHQPSTKANFAHIDLLNRDLINRDIKPSMIDRMWEASKKGRLQSLGNVDDNRAKAKVAFVIPGALARQLGCAP